MKVLVFCLYIPYFSLGLQVGNAQVYKHIDRFQSNKYYLEFTNGNGLLKDTILYNQGLRITYNFTKGDGECFTVIRNYDIATQDYSFIPSAFALTLKGGNSADQIKLKLWEDINTNRQFDDKDEVYASIPYLLGDTTLHTIQFPVESFIRVAGKGDHKLNLNRIRAWDIEIKSCSNNFHTGELYLSDLRFYSNYKPVYDEQAALTGTFITLSTTDTTKNGNWTQQQWNSQLRKMKSMNLSKIIVQYSVHQNISWFSPCGLPYIKHAEATINKIFNAAEITGIKVYLGLSFSETWYNSDKALESTYCDLYQENKTTIDELFSLFGSSPAFGGWYIPQELNDYDWQTKNKKAMLFAWLQKVSEYAHTKDASKPVIIAPYFNLWQPADLIESWYNELLEIAKDVDWIYPQDGVGTSIKNVHIDIPNYCRRIKAACEKHGKKFGVTVEAFKQLAGWPVDNGIFSAIPKDINQITDQIQEAYQLKPNDIILFEWTYLKINK